MRKGNATNIRIGQTLKYLGCESKHTYKGATYKLIKVAAKIKNTRHSSGLDLTQRLSAAYTLMSTLMTRQALVRVLLANYQTITGKPDE